VLQVRQTRTRRELALRELHATLLSRALDDPQRLACWGPIGEPDGAESARQHVYLIVSHWRLTWELGDLSEPHLELLADQFFAGEVGRRFWARACAARRTA
jgi:hypothetical protein